jgi:hypothetical protein
MKYQIWDKTSPVITPSGDEFSADQWKEKWKWSKLTGVKAIISAGVINGAWMMEFNQTKQRYIDMGAPITEQMTDQEVIDAMEAWDNRVPETTVTSDDRAAAALELIALSSMPDA